MKRVCERLLFISKPAYCCFSVILFQMRHVRVHETAQSKIRERILCDLMLMIHLMQCEGLPFQRFEADIRNLVMSAGADVIGEKRESECSGPRGQTRLGQSSLQSLTEIQHSDTDSLEMICIRFCLSFKLTGELTLGRYSKARQVTKTQIAYRGSRAGLEVTSEYRLDDDLEAGVTEPEQG